MVEHASYSLCLAAFTISDAIITTTITAAASVIVAIIAHRSKQRDKEAIQQKIEEKTIAVIGNPIENRTLETPPPPAAAEAILNSTHFEIYSTIDAAAPFHRDEIRANFLGKRVRWKTKLSGISHLSDRISISAKIPDGDGVLFCYTNRSNAEVFLSAAVGTGFFVTGTIERVSKYEAALINCVFEIIPDTEKK